jgi:ABC-type antimicrobial peptide transport system permease subunit
MCSVCCCGQEVGVAVGVNAGLKDGLRHYVDTLLSCHQFGA